MHLGTSLARASRCARRARRVERERRARRELSSVSRCSTARTIRAPVVERSDSSSLVDSNETRERRGGSPTDDERRRTSIDGIGVGDMARRKGKRRFDRVGKTPAKKFVEAFATVATPMRRGIDFPMERTSSAAAFRSWIERNVFNRSSIGALKWLRNDTARREIRKLVFGYPDEEGESTDDVNGEGVHDSGVSDLDEEDDDQDPAMQRCLAADARHRVTLLEAAGMFDGAFRRVVTAIQLRKPNVDETALRDQILRIRRDAQRVFPRVVARRRGWVRRRAQKNSRRATSRTRTRVRARRSRAPSRLSLSLPSRHPRVSRRGGPTRARLARARRGVVAFARRRGRATDDASARGAGARWTASIHR